MTAMDAVLRGLLAAELRQVGSAGDLQFVARAYAALAMGTPLAGVPRWPGAPGLRGAVVGYVVRRLGGEAPPAGGNAEPPIATRAFEVLGDGPRAAPFFRNVIASQCATGAFTAQRPDIAPEMYWLSELALMHALATHIARSGDASPRPALIRAVDFHARETQLDHATTWPWALHALALTEEGGLTGELVLQAALMQGAGRLDPMGTILVADALLSWGVTADPPAGRMSPSRPERNPI